MNPSPGAAPIDNRLKLLLVHVSDIIQTALKNNIACCGSDHNICFLGPTNIMKLINNDRSGRRMLGLKIMWQAFKVGSPMPGNFCGKRGADHQV